MEIKGHTTRQLSPLQPSKIKGSSLKKLLKNASGVHLGSTIGSFSDKK